MSKIIKNDRFKLILDIIKYKMTDLKHDYIDKLLWIDLEMTGLDKTTDRIIEVAAIVTDFDFKEFDSFESVVRQSPKILSHMNKWVRDMTAANGLIERIPSAPEEPDVVRALKAFINKNFDQPVVLAGNSVHFDCDFIQQWWPSIFELLHYRVLDVSSFKIIMQNKYKLIFKKRETHRALDDIRESMAELKFYLKSLKL